MSSILNIIAEADRRQLVEDADAAIGNIVQALEDNYERTGEVTIKVKFKSVNGTLQVTPELNHKLSNPKRVTSTIFMNEDGTLSRRDPRQPTMPSVVEADELNRRRGD